MLRVRFPIETSGRVREAMLTEDLPSEMLGAPARSVRRATLRRASIRRATARNRRRHSEASITELLARHFGSTVGDLAKRLNPDHGAVATRLTQLAKVKRGSNGFRGHWRCLSQRRPSPSTLAGAKTTRLSRGQG